jgi:hypothetical protein
MIITGWWLSHPSETYDPVSWDYEIPIVWKNNPNVPNHQPVYITIKIIVKNYHCAEANNASNI